MKQIIIICCLAIGAIVSFDSCAPYYYSQPYGIAPRVVIAPPRIVTPYYAPYYRPHRGHHRGYYRGY